MSSEDGESDVSSGLKDGDVDDAPQNAAEALVEPERIGTPDSQIKRIISQEQEDLDGADVVSDTNGLSFDRYGSVKRPTEEVASESPAATPFSPEGSISTPDETPSIHGSLISSPGSSVPASHASLSRPALQPFERRFSSRISPSPWASPRPSSPAFLNIHSRQSSLSSQLLRNQDEADTPQPPWEVVRWTKLKKVSGQAFSEIGKRNFGRPTCMAVAASIVIGTSKGLILVFDYHQTLKSIIGPGTKAIECGSVTSLAISADHTTVAGGHASGNIFTWELARSAKPFLHIPPLDRHLIGNRTGDGHVSDASILHVGFLGTRHTALVSADDGGMAFSHLATRGLGAVGRTVKTTRILGRYPASPDTVERPRKPSSVLAFSPLPLGNVEQPTDGLGLTALLTPYLLVIVSTTPIAETQHKASRPKEIAPHGALSGCLAWFPAVKLKNTGGESVQAVSKTKLVYCWCNILTVLDVEATEHEEKNKPPSLHFHPRSRWRAEEAIVAVQWLSRSVLSVLTISQRLIILEDTALRMTDSFDLLQKHIFHQDLFSKQLHPVVEQLDEEDVSMHGVVADAFYMSFRAYKGRLFLLGFNDVSIGTLSNWADRLLALMEEGDYIAAIELATSYYNGDADKLTVGLSEDAASRHAMVQEKLVDMISASLKYTFARTQSSEGEESKQERISELANVTFIACLSMQETDFLFEDVYAAFEDASAQPAFFSTLEPYILNEEITAVPPDVLKDLISHYAVQGRTATLEEMICRLDTSTLDIDQVTILCRQFNLYDALPYVWTQALRDYVTPLIDLLKVLQILVTDAATDDAVQEHYMASAMKIFPYLAYTLTGRIYPNGLPLSDVEADEAKAALYSYLFSGKHVEWPKGSGDVFLVQSSDADELDQSFPYLRLILRFDTASFMSMLNEAFEDSYLNGDQASSPDGLANGFSPERSFARRPTRQYILNILLGIVSEGRFEPEDVIYVYMFVARNLPKFPQYIMLPGSALHRLLEGLCDCPSEAVADDCQLSVEYLLSVYHPSNLESLVPLFERAGFHRVLKSVYAGAKQYARLLQAYLNDQDDRTAVFDCITNCLRPSRGLNKKQLAEFEAVIITNAQILADIDAAQAAQTLKAYAPSLLPGFFRALEADSYLQYIFLRAILEPEQDTAMAHMGSPLDPSTAGFIESYVQLMCKYNPLHVADYISLLRTGDLRLNAVLPAMEASGVIDAAVMLMAQDGLARDAMTRLIKHLGTLETALAGLLDAVGESPDAANAEEAAEDLLDAVQKYVKIGIWLCQGQSKRVKTNRRDHKRRSESPDETDLDEDELLWLDLIDTIVSITKNVTESASDVPEATNPSSGSIDTGRITTALRAAVQQTFSALLASTAAANAPIPSQSQPQQHGPSFLAILRTFLGRAARSAPSLSDLRAVLADVFAAYAFEETLLALANRELDRDVFAQVDEVNRLRQRGWRPRGNVCEGCRNRVWGPGAGGGVWEKWVERREREALGRRGKGGREDRGKGKAVGVVEDEGGGASDGRGDGEGTREEQDPLVVFACRHLWHRSCLVARMGEVENEMVEQGERAFRCPLEG
ncbi:hypothetical protein K490DRAFT_40356 [Saccharata proteae CBS 121410]|uniref:Vacuolar protein sorting-associated protein 8 central domain-containing protein n=1 Tax=Saccharata proteae CBS 121410 TaxID=1314787 RepID=A0A9P4HWL9_9PEZI|nr:hypothetical protein K490DRAFT_40356 [Saccharata proteae CBS 121410]